MVLPARQLREARPTVALAFLFPLFVVPVGLFAFVAVNQLHRDNFVEAGLGLAFASAFALLYVVCSAFLLQSARRPGIVVRTELVPLGPSPEAVRARIRAAAGPSQRIVLDEAERMVVLLGQPVASARMRGAHDLADTPLRVDIELASPAAHDAYRHAGAARIVVRELLIESEPAVDRATALFAQMCTPR